MATPAHGLQDVAAKLIESDRKYFEIAAVLMAIPGAAIAMMPNLSHIPSGCVVHRINGRQGVAKWRAWIYEVEEILRSVGCFSPRLYLDQCLPDLEEVLREHGYTAQVEIGLSKSVTTSMLPPQVPLVTLHPVQSESEWTIKASLHSATEKGPDGHQMRPDHWVQLEQRKCGTGQMQVYLAYYNGNICGTVGALEVDDLLRLKNLTIYPPYRRQGLAQATVYALLLEAIRRGKQTLGCFALLDSAGHRVYKKVGLSDVTQQVEWYKRYVTDDQVG